MYQSYDGYPVELVTDLGTENGIMAGIHASWWINHFKDLVLEEVDMVNKAKNAFMISLKKQAYFFVRKSLEKVSLYKITHFVFFISHVCQAFSLIRKIYCQIERSRIKKKVLL